MRHKRELKTFSSYLVNFSVFSVVNGFYFFV